MEIKSVGLGYGGLGNISGAPVPTTHAGEGREYTDGLVTESGVAQTQTVSETGKTPDGSTENKDGKEKQREATDDQIKQAVSEINKRANETEAVFGIHEKTNRITIKIVDKKTKDVIREVPAEKTLDLIAKAWELAGLMVDEKR